MTALQSKIAAIIRGTGAAKKQPGLSTELKELNMSTVLDLVTPVSAKKQPEVTPANWLDRCIERGLSTTFAEVATLTPALAGELLRRNPDNRGVRQTKVEQYANDMRAGQWRFNGEPLIISIDGLLNDGQHRAEAAVLANTAIPAIFMFGIERETRTTVDQGAARAASDYLAMDKVPHASVQASVARILVAYERGGGLSLSGNNYVTNADIMKRVLSDPNLEVSAHFASVHAKAAKAYAAPAVIGFCHYVFTKVNRLQAIEYMTKVCAGEGLVKRDPAYTVRERLVSMNKSRDGKIHVIFRGWNAYRQGRKLDIAKIIGGASNLPALL